MPSHPRNSTRSSIGGSNRRAAADSLGTAQQKPARTPTLQASLSSDSLEASGYGVKAARTPVDKSPIKSDFQAEKPKAKFTTDIRGKTLSGPQETALQVMQDFFSRRPLVQMRNAFRDADTDNSGALDIDEFQQAVRNMNTTLTDKDARTIFNIVDEDGSGTLGIDEFFINFRSDRWPREKFFWDKQCGGGENITKKERVDLHNKLTLEQQNPAKRSTDEIMRILEEKVHVVGSAEKIFKRMDSNFNGSLDVHELADAIRPYEIEVDEKQAAEVLSRINAIAGKPPLEDMNYNSFALAFNSSHPPSRMGGNFAPEHARKPVRSASDASLRTYEYEMANRTLETVDTMKSISTAGGCPAAPPLNHSASRGAVSDQERAKLEATQKRHDMMAQWRGVDGMGMEEGGQMGKEIMKVGRDIDWFADNQAPSLRGEHGLYKDVSRSKSLSQLTPLEQGVAFDPLATQASFERGSSVASSSRPGSTPAIRGALGHTRSRLSLALESSGSQSTLECLKPGRDSHHHAEETDRFSHTSSIASLNSISNAVNGRQPADQVKAAEKRRHRVERATERRRERESTFLATVTEHERQYAAAAEERKKTLSGFHRRFGEQQLLQLTRGMENGKRPVWLERPSSQTWVPAPPHLTSHWRTIAGIYRNSYEDPGREDFKTPVGRRRFPESERGTIVEGPGGGKPVWGGAPQPYLASQPFLANP